MARLGHEHGAEAPRQRLVFLDEFLVLAERRRADDADFTPGEHALQDVGRVGRCAQRRPRADERVRLVDEENQVRTLLQLAEHVLNAVLEHAAQHGAGHQAVQLQAHDLAVAQSGGERLGLELDAAREAFGDRRLADAGLADEHHRVGALAVAQDLDGLLDLVDAAEDGRQPVLAREQVQVRREVLEERRQLELLLQPLVVALDVADAGRDARDQRLGLDARLAHDRGRHALAVLEQRGEEVSRLQRLAPGARRVVMCELEHQLRRRRHAQVAAVDARLAGQLRFGGVQDGVGIEVEVAHHLREQVPFRLGEGDQQVLVADDGVLAAAGLLDGAFRQALP